MSSRGRKSHASLEQRLAESLKRAPIGECLEFERIIELAREGRRARDYYTLMQHVITCPACRRAVLQARALIEAQRRSLARWLRWWALPRPLAWASALGVVAVVALTVWLARSASTERVAGVDAKTRSVATVPDRPTLPAPRSGATAPRLAEARPAAPSAPLRTDLTPVPASQRELQEARRLAPFVQSAVNLLQQATATLGVRVAPQPDALWLTLTEPDLLRNAALEPAETTRFRWLPVANAERYEVRLTRESVLFSTTLLANQTEFTLNNPLSAGEYELHLIVVDQEQQRMLRARFYVLNAEQLRQLAWARQHAREKPLLSAAVFYQIDRYAEALECLERAAQRYPTDALVARWRTVVQQRIQQRARELN